MADFSQLEADAKALAQKLLADSKTGIDAILTAVGSDGSAAVPTLSADVEGVLLDFVPSMFRGVVQGFLSGAVTNLDATAQAAIKNGIAIAMARINALL